MTSVTSTGVSGSASSQAFRLALLVKLFQTQGKSSEGGKSRPTETAAPAPLSPTISHPTQVNSSAGLASMYEALQAPNTNSVSDLLSRLLEAVDTDGDGAISAAELQAVTELTTVPTSEPPAQPAYPVLIQQNMGTQAFAGPIGPTLPVGTGQLTQNTLEPLDVVAQKATEQAQKATMFPTPTRSAYEALFQAMSQAFPQAKAVSGATGGQRYSHMLQSLANAA